MCHPPTAGRSLRSPRQSHPPLAPGLALRSAAESPVPAQWQEAGGKWQSLPSTAAQHLLAGPRHWLMSQLYFLVLCHPFKQLQLSVLSLGNPHWELTFFPVCFCFAPTMLLFTSAPLQVTPD